MTRKIFISYKYNDSQVLQKEKALFDFSETTARDYVDDLQEILDEENHINKGEKDNEDLSNFKDSTIASHLRERIFDSTLTIILLSKGMKEFLVNENDQWIPWEISYSLREKTRGEKNSNPNALLAVALPDRQGSYEHFILENTCSKCKCVTLQTTNLFKIIRENTFNTKQPNYSDCENHNKNSVYKGDHSYVSIIKWSNFIESPNIYIENAYKKRSEIDNFNISKQA